MTGFDENRGEDIEMIGATGADLDIALRMGIFFGNPCRGIARDR